MLKKVQIVLVATIASVGLTISTPVFAATAPGGVAERFIDNVTAASISVRDTANSSSPSIYTLSQGADTVRYHPNEGDTSISGGYYAYYAFYPKSGTGSYSTTAVGYVTSRYNNVTTYSSVASFGKNTTSSANNIWYWSSLSGSAVGSLASQATTPLGAAANDNPNAWSHVSSLYNSDGWVNGWYMDAYAGSI
jgi:hypothetical protein